MNYTSIKLTLLSLTFLITGTLFGQNDSTYKIAKSSGKLVIEGINGLEIEGYAGNEIIFTAESRSSSSAERAQGLSAINSLGQKDNTGIGLAVATEGDEVKVSAIKKNSGKYTMKVPQGVSISFKNSSNQMGKLYIKDVSGEVETSLQYGSVQLENVTGPLSINTVYGKIEATFKTLNTKSPTSLYSVYALVDVTVPASTKADVHLTSNYGDMFTDFDIQVDANSKLSSSKVQGKINGGGSELRLNSTYQNIYLRKQ